MTAESGDVAGNGSTVFVTEASVPGVFVMGVFVTGGTSATGGEATGAEATGVCELSVAAGGSPAELVPASFVCACCESPLSTSAIAGAGGGGFNV